MIWCWISLLSVDQAAPRRRASLYIGGVWIREPKELHMKRLLGLLLVMVHLKGMTSLRKLDLSNTQVTDTGVAELQHQKLTRPARLAAELSSYR